MEEYEDEGIEEKKEKLVERYTTNILIKKIKKEIIKKNWRKKYDNIMHWPLHFIEFH